MRTHLICIGAEQEMLLDPASVTSTPLTGAPMAVHKLGLGNQWLDYRDIWQLQQHLHAEVAAGERQDTLLLLEHNEVFTAGSRTQDSDRPSSSSTTPVVDVDRGGRITWHGPGQLVGYPIVRLPHRLDVVAYVRALEGWLMATCQSLGLQTIRIEGRSGVWIPAAEQSPASVDSGWDGTGGSPETGQSNNRPNPQPPADTRETPEASLKSPAGTFAPKKIAAVGVRVAKGVAMHGFALNCDCRLSWADEIIPCGIADAGVTSLSAETNTHITTSAAARQLLALSRSNELGESPNRPTKGTE